MSEKQITDAEWAYLAAIIDCHGWFLVSHDSKGNTRTSTTISSKEKKVLDFVVDKFGGIISKKNFRKRDDIEIYSYNFSLRLSNKNIQYICMGILDYLQAKKEQCKIMIDIRKLIGNKYSKGFIGTLPLSQMDVEKRHILSDRMKIENAKIKIYRGTNRNIR